jgi:putative ABC transport system substrate-binding protein
MDPSRRAFVIAAAATLWPRPAGAQRPRTVHRIGWISTDEEPDPFLDGFREGLRQNGWVEGQNVEIDARYGTVEQLGAVVAELKDKVAFIAAAGPAIRAMRGTKDVYGGASWPQFLRHHVHVSRGGRQAPSALEGGDPRSP